MNINSKLLTLAAFNILLSVQLYAQTNLTSSLSKIIPASPEASAIPLYQNYEVEPLTGAPQIEVPLFEINTKIGKIPFKLSYHIGRLKSSELTGPVGWGWTLTPNLGITRSILGLKDDLNGGYIASNSYFGSRDCLYNLGLARGNADEQPDDFYYSLLSGSGRFLYRRDGSFSVPNKVKITRASNDAFQIIDIDGTIYKFGRYSTGTSQTIEKSGTGWLQAPTTNIVSWRVTEIISYDKTDTIRFLYGNPDTWDVQHYNAQYRFIEYPGRDFQPQIYRTTYNGIGCTEYPYIAQWEPIRVRPGSPTWPVSATNMYDVFDVNISEFNQGIVNWADVSSFCSPTLPTTCKWETTFDLGSESVCFKVSATNYNCYSYDVKSYSGNYVCPTGATYNTDGMDMPADEVLTNNRIEELPLTGIVYRGGMASLTYENSRCTGMTIYAANAGGAYNPIRKIKVAQHRIAENYSGVNYKTDYRYLLDSITIGGGDGLTKERYKFEYLNNSILPLAVNIGSDMFGFPDYHSSEAVPKMAYRINNYKWREIEQVGAGSEWGSDRSGTVVAMFGMKKLASYSSMYSPPPPVALLKKITYPTGGTANFEFENNRFLGPDLVVQYTGGGYRIKSIKYTNGFGIDSLTRTFAYGINESGAGVLKYLPDVSDYMFQQTTDLVDPKLGFTVRKLITTFNATPFFDMVFDNGAAVLYPQVTEYIGKPGASNGKTVYDYVIGGINNYHIPNSPVQENKRNEWMFKYLSEKKDYAFTNNAFSLVKKSSYSYSDFVTDTVRCGAAYQNFFDEDDAVICSNQGVFSHRYDIYPGISKLREINDTLYAQDGKYIPSKTTYLFDPSTLLLRTTITQTSKSEEVQQKIWYSNDISLLNGWDAGQLSLLTTMKQNNRIAIPVKEERYINGILNSTTGQYFMTSVANNQIYPLSLLSSIYYDPLKTDIQFLNYDALGNLVEQRKANDTKEVYFYGYNGKYPVAKLLNTDYNTARQYINQKVLDNPPSDDQLRTELQNLRRNLPNAQVTTYTYSPEIGITSETDPAGRVTYFEYDAQGRLKAIKDADGKILKLIDYQYAQPNTK